MDTSHEKKERFKMSEIVIRPGLLVALSSQVRGNTTYLKEQLEYAHLVAGGEERSKWETTKMVIDPAEQEAASKVRDKCRSLIKSVCSKAEFGLLCPEDRRADLLERIEECNELTAEFNREAVYTHVGVSVFWGTVAQDDVRATREIMKEVRELMEDMQSGLAELDVKKVRAIADKARQMGQILTPEAKTKVDIAVNTARRACTRIVKAGEAVVGEIDRQAIRTIGMARTAFLDFDLDEIDVAAPVGNGRALELEVS